MKRKLNLCGKAIAFSVVSLLFPSIINAQEWLPGGAISTTPIDRPANVTIGLTATNYAAINNKLTVNGGNVTYARSTAMSGNISATGVNFVGSATTSLSDVYSYNTQGGGLGVNGTATANTLTSTQINRFAVAKGGQFATTINDPIPAISSAFGPYEIAGVSGNLNGSITNYPVNGYVAAVAGVDAIKGTETWGGYFEGRGYFEGNVGIGTRAPLARLDVRGDNILQSPTLSSVPYPEKHTLMGQISAGCDIYGFRAQFNPNLSIDMGIEAGATPTISWANPNGDGDLEFDCDDDTSGCGTLISKMSCSGPYAFSTYGRGYFSGGVTVPSDRNLKSSIHDLKDPMGTIRQLRGVTYEYKSEVYPEYHFPAGEQVGFIAQEVKESIPQAVTVDGNGIHGVNYDMIIPILVEGVKELDADNTFAIAQNNAQEQRIVDLETTIAVQQSEIAELKSLVRELISTQDAASQKSSAEGALGATETATLDQNVPNPANGSTTISYFVPSNARLATLSIMDINGNLVAEYNVQSGNGKVEVSTRGLVSGVYLYSLNLDGNKVATRRMVIAE